LGIIRKLIGIRFAVVMVAAAAMLAGCSTDPGSGTGGDDAGPGIHLFGSRDGSSSEDARHDAAAPADSGTSTDDAERDGGVPEDATMADAADVSDAAGVDGGTRDAETGDDGASTDTGTIADTGNPPSDGGPDTGVADAGFDAGQAPDAGAPECTTDGDCGTNRKCLASICRDTCMVWCYNKPSGDVCHSGYCVECESDGDCAGGDVCDTLKFICVPKEPPDPDKVLIGVMYHQWWVPGRWVDNPRNHAYEPVLGHYDNSNPAIIDQHIAWSKQAGINTWVLDTWITDRDWPWVEKNSLAVMDRADAQGMKYFLLIDGWFEFAGSDDGCDAQAIASKINQRFSAWFKRPNYVKVNGKPVIFFWASWGKQCSLFDKIRAGIEGIQGPVFMTGDTDNSNNACFDRVMEYNSYSSERDTWPEQIDRQDGMWNDWQDNGWPWAPTAIPGYNDTYVRQGNPPIPLDPDYFRQSLQVALKYNQHADPPWLFVCSWSEWHEGSNIEPSNESPDPEIFLKVMYDELKKAGWVR
jgi:hypothetical protein